MRPYNAEHVVGTILGYKQQLPLTTLFALEGKVRAKLPDVVFFDITEKGVQENVIDFYPNIFELKDGVIKVLPGKQPLAQLFFKYSMDQSVVDVILDCLSDPNAEE